MVVLSDKGILAARHMGELGLEPWNPASLQPASIDLHLKLPGMYANQQWSKTRHLEYEPFDPQDKDSVAYVQSQSELILRPGSLLLAETQERIEVGSSLIGQIEGLSSLGRLGLNIYQTCGLLDPGFRGVIVLELTAHKSIRLRDGMRICQVIFSTLDQRAENPYEGKYQDQTQVTGFRGNE